MFVIGSDLLLGTPPPQWTAPLAALTPQQVSDDFYLEHQLGVTDG